MLSVQQVLQALQGLLEPLAHKELLEMSDLQVQWALQALQGLQAHKVLKVLQDLRVQRERQDQSERQVLQDRKE